MTILNHRGERLAPQRDHKKSAAHRFEYNEALGIGQRREDKEISRVIVERNILVRDCPVRMTAPLSLKRLVSDSSLARIGPSPTTTKYTSRRIFRSWAKDCRRNATFFSVPSLPTKCNTFASEASPNRARRTRARAADFRLLLNCSSLIPVGST